MRKQWYVAKGNLASEGYVKTFFEQLVPILEEIGVENLSSRFTWKTDSTTSARDCNCSSSNLEVMKDKGYPEWIADFSTSKFIKTLPSANAGSDWEEVSVGANYLDGFVSFDFEGIEYCIVYNFTYMTTTGTSSTYKAGHCSILYKEKKEGAQPYRQTFKHSGSLAESGGGGIFSNSDFILIEHFKTSYANCIFFTASGETGTNYASSGKFTSIGRYNLLEGLSAIFPNGIAVGDEEVINMLPNKSLMYFQSDSEGLFRIINQSGGDVIGKQLLLGNVYIGVQNVGIIGKIETVKSINSLIHPVGTEFDIEGKKYKKLRFPSMGSTPYSSTSFSNLTTHFTNSFHLMEE